MEPIETEEVELAFARLEWARAAASCLDLPTQREALQWHLACWESALAAVKGVLPARGEA